jgi:hypothetical protein
MTATASRNTSRMLVVAALLAATILPATASTACTTARIDIYDRNAGQALQSYRHHGRRYVVGTPGNEYAIRVRNCTAVRVLAVVSVDGVNVVTGETASTDQAGYVVEPGGYVNIQGWRKDLDRTAAFYFSDPSDSYASRTGRPDDLGVIGVALFREKAYSPHLSREDSALPAPADAGASAQEATAARDQKAAAPRMEASVGTGHGRREYSPVESVEFERASDRPDQRVVIRYDRRENLVAMGVLPTSPRWHEPDPFPARLGFVPDP